MAIVVYENVWGLSLCTKNWYLIIYIGRNVVICMEEIIENNNII